MKKPILGAMLLLGAMLQLTGPMEVWWERLINIAVALALLFLREAIRN